MNYFNDSLNLQMVLTLLKVDPNQNILLQQMLQPIRIVIYLVDLNNVDKELPTFKLSTNHFQLFLCFVLGSFLSQDHLQDQLFYHPTNKHTNLDYKLQNINSKKIQFIFVSQISQIQLILDSLYPHYSQKNRHEI